MLINELSSLNNRSPKYENSLILSTHAALDVYDVLSSDTNGEFKKRNPSPYKYIQPWQ